MSRIVYEDGNGDRREATLIDSSGRPVTFETLAQRAADWHADWHAARERGAAMVRRARERDERSRGW
jgi:hypothetical protein